jgi:thioredoxin-related protein
VSVENVDWASHQQWVLLVLQKGCRFCEESMPFYKRLTAQLSDQANAHLVALLPQTEKESRQYLTDNMVDIADVRQASLRSVGVQGTPTLLLVDKNGTVLEQWLGKVPASQEDTVLSRLKGER